MTNFKKIISERYNKLKEEGSFTYGFTWTFSGTSLGILLQIIFAPILSRIYGPDAYGEFAIYNLITTNLVVFTALSYPRALIPSKKGEFYSLSLFIILFTCSILVILSVLFFPFENSWQEVFPKLDGLNWMYIVIWAVILINSKEIVFNWNIKNNYYSHNVKADVISQGLSKVYSIIFGIVYYPIGLGLISAEIVKLLLSVLLSTGKRLRRKLISKTPKLTKTEIRQAFLIAKKYRNYPKFIWPGTWINMISSQLPVIFFTAYFSISELGAYAFAGSLIGIPNRLIGNAIRPVFFQKCQEILNNEGIKNLRKFTKKISYYLYLISIPAFSIIYLFGDLLFGFVFGERWVLAGQVAAFLSIYQFIAFSASPVSNIFLTLRREKSLLIFQIFLLSIRLLSLVAAFILKFDFIQTILMYSSFNAFAYLILHLSIFKILR